MIGPRVSLSLDGLTLELNETKANFIGIGLTQSREAAHVPGQGKTQGADGGLQQGQLLYDPRLKWDFDVIMRPADYDLFYTIWDRHEWYRVNYITPRNFIRFDNQRILYEESGSRSTAFVPGSAITTTASGVSYFASWFVNLRLPEKHYTYIGNNCKIEGRQYQVRFKLDYLARVP